MASSTHKISYHDLGVLIRNVGEAAQKSQKEAVFRAALHMKDVITNEIHGDLGGKDYFSRMEQKKTKTGNFIGVRPANNRVGVRFDVKGTYNPTALLVAYGPAGLLEYGGKPHLINAKKPELAAMKRGAAKRRLVAQRELAIAFGDRGAFSGSRPLRTPYGPRYSVLLQRGARPKKSFSRGVEKATPKSTEIATSLIQSKTIQRLRTQFGTFTYVMGEQGAFRPGAF
jgi:hypothetical protein